MVDGGEEVFRETSEQGRWLSYDELGQIRGIGRPSAVKLAQRERWQRRSGNDRTARVLVPLDWLKPARRQPEASFREVFRGEFPEVSRLVGALEGELAGKGRAIAVLETAVATLREQLTQANGRVEAELRRVDQAEQTTGTERARADRAEARADRAEQGGDSERAHADALRQRLDAMQDQLNEAHAALQAAEAAGARAYRAEQGRDQAEQARDAERARADALREQIDAEQAETRQRVASAEQAVEGERARADELAAQVEARLAAAEAAAKAAQDNAEALQAELTASRTAVEQASVLARAAQEKAEEAQRADDARRFRGTWARLRAAWRGE